MKARQIIHDGEYYPEDVVRLDTAFAGAWEQLKDRFSLARGEDHDTARERLATIIVALGRGPLADDPELQAMASRVRKSRPAGGVVPYSKRTPRATDWRAPTGVFFPLL